MHYSYLLAFSFHLYSLIYVIVTHCMFDTVHPTGEAK